MIILSWLFGWIVALRNFLFDVGILRAEKLPGKVISIGNIAAGGTGKTPTTIAIAQHLLGKGARPAILTRGYRGGLKSGDWLVLLGGKRIAGNASDVTRPDEAILQSMHLPTVPVIVGSKRKKNARTWLSEFEKHGAKAPTHWLLDDGFQHRVIARDVDIVLLDAEKPFGKLLPQGRFREPTESLGRAHAVVFTRSKMPTLPRVGDRSYLALVAPDAKVGFSEMIFAQPKSVWPKVNDGEPNDEVFLVSGIAQPKEFRKAVEALGIKILGEKIFSDHQAIDISSVNQMVGQNKAPILMTEKDWARCEPEGVKFVSRILVLPMQATLSPEIAAIL